MGDDKVGGAWQGLQDVRLVEGVWWKLLATVFGKLNGDFFFVILKK